MARRNRTRIGSPLTPAILEQIEVLGEFPAAAKDFKPDGDWTQTYRIWGCHGYRKSGNYNTGFLKLGRNKRDDKTFTLKVQQQLVNEEGILNIVQAELWCRKDQISSPVQWDFSSRFIDALGKDVPELKVTEKARIRENTLGIKSGEQNFKRRAPQPLSCNWSVFEAVQRLAFEKGTAVSFNLLEDLSVLKLGHKLSYRGVYPLKKGDKQISLQWFQELGNGVLPYEYWLDDGHRVLIVASLNKVYILDDNAEAAAAQWLLDERKSYQVRLKRHEERNSAGLDVEGGKK